MKDSEHTNANKDLAYKCTKQCDHVVMFLEWFTMFAIKNMSERIQDPS